MILNYVMAFGVLAMDSCPWAYIDCGQGGIADKAAHANRPHKRKKRK